MQYSVSSSNQRVFWVNGEDIRSFDLPSPWDRIGEGRLRWGNVGEVGTPAYWSSQAWLWEQAHPRHYRLGRSLREELLACLLGGYGIPAETGLAAYERLRAVDAEDPEYLTSEDRVGALLSDPLSIGDRQVKYRFAGQKARYVAAALRGLVDIDAEAADVSLRDALTELPGIGLKTASWIVRNWRGSDEVSILDVHIVRIARMLHLFDPALRVERHYRTMEIAYLGFAHTIGARPSMLDSVMWMTMRQLSPSILKGFVAPGFEPKWMLFQRDLFASV